MKPETVLAHRDDPIRLEELYRASPRGFRQALMGAREERPDDIVLRVWAARLEGTAVPAPPVLGLAPVIVIALGCALLVRVPAIWLTEDWYYPRFAPTIVLLSLALYFWAEDRDRRRLGIGAVLAAVSAVFVSALPGQGDSVLMSLLHLPVLWWMVLGLTFVGSSWRDTGARIRFLRYNGELLILGTLVGLGGLVFSGITVALFEMASEGIEETYFENIGVMGVMAVPVAATFLYDTVFHRHTGIASVLARVFAPLFLAMTATYLVVAALGGQNPFLDRSSLITMNGLLLVVLGMVVLSIAERGDDQDVGWVDRINLALLVVTLLIDVLALSAIVFRLASYGFTPNRVVVLGANVVILVHLALICRAQLRFTRGSVGVEAIRGAAAGYLPAYAAWAAVVSFLLPLVFGFA